MSDEEAEVQFESDDDVEATSHNKLLSAVSRLYKKQRVENAKRTEPAREVSEFHLSAPGAEGGNASDPLSTATATVGVKELLGSLNSTAKQKKIKDRIHNIKTVAETLSAPLERIDSERIKRSVGYDNAKTQVSRWDGLVEKNRLAPELSFPLPAPREKIRNRPLSFATAFTKPTELELKLAEVLRGSKVTKKTPEPKEGVFKMTMAEMLKQRQLMKKIKVQESFKIVKAMKQNKIKSKKYRRLMRKEKAKEELKEFENLKAVDPEAALEQLEKGERERALERASLRHRNTGRWAKGLAVRAKYDKEARKELAEQVAKSRELTLKKKLEDDAEDCISSDEETNQPTQRSSENPWMSETSGPDISVSDFMKGYQNYWKDKKAAEEKEKQVQEDSIVKGLVKSDSSGQEKDAHDEKNAPGDKELQSEESEEHENGEVFDNLDNFIVDSKDRKSNPYSSPSADTNNLSASESNGGLVHKSVSKISSTNGKNVPSKIKSNLLGKSQRKRPNSLQDSSDDESTLLNDLKAVASDVLEVNSLSAGPKPPVEKRKSRKKKLKRRKEGLWAIEQDTEIEEGIKGSKSKKQTVTTEESSNLREELHNIGEMFEDIEDRLQKKVEEKLDSMEKSMKEVKHKSISSDLDCDYLVEKKKRGNKNETNFETSRGLNSNHTNESDMTNDAIHTLTVSEQAKQNGSSPGGLINPNEYMVVQPRRMAHEAGDITLPSDLVDDEEPNDEGNAAKDLAEAFADDDLISDFRNEKAAAEKVKHELDLTLPGWGSWGGTGIEKKTKKKRNRRRKFVLAFAPTQLAPQPKRENIIINPDAESALKDLRVKRLPAPFASEKAFELSVRAPIGRDWQSEVAFDGLTRPPISTKAGKIIRPMADDQLKLYDKKVKVAVFKKNEKNKRKPLG